MVCPFDRPETIGLKGEYAFGDICWDALAQKWTWQILPNYPLSHLNIRK
jgi:hypothetical protein